MEDIIQKDNLGTLDEEHNSSLMSHGLQCRLNTTWKENAVL